MKCYIVFDDYYTRNTKAISHAIRIYKKRMRLFVFAHGYFFVLYTYYVADLK